MQDMLLLLAVSFGINIGMFVIAFRKQTDKLTDISYSITFITLIWFAIFMAGNASAANYVLAVMVTIWAARLGTFLLIRIRKTGVDHRFDDMRSHALRFGKFWALQALSVWVILIPSLLAMGTFSGSLTWMSLAGGILWCIGLLVEATADAQKYAFSQNSDNKNKWIDSGVWRYSRHPNYFGEILVWIGVYVYVFPLLTAQQAIIGAVGPLFITSLLLFVSGVPPLEKSANKRWGDDAAYQRYKKRTSILIPWFPSK